MYRLCGSPLLLELFEFLRIAAGVLSLILVLITGIVLWRVRGLLNWNRSQKRELAELQKIRDRSDGVQRQALDEILSRCSAIRHSTRLDAGSLAELPAFCRSIAACYHPDEPHPELCVSIGHLLLAAHQLADRLEVLLKVPGFEHIGRLRVRQVRRIYQWYSDFSASPMISWILARWQALRTVRHALRFIMPDPLTWIAYLSQRLTILMAMRCLLIDLFVYTGKLAMEAYGLDEEDPSMDTVGQTSDSVMDAYEDALEAATPDLAPDLDRLRVDLTGLPARLWRPPDMLEWWQAVKQAAHIIAAGHFPQAEAPLEEATCRVLLDRCRHWLQAMSDARRMPVVRPLYRISLRRLHQIKMVTESDLLRSTGKVAGGMLSIWRWARWPIKVFRWARRRSPAGIALDLGSTMALKATHNYLARYGYDSACRELDTVYRLSAVEGNSGQAAEENHHQRDPGE